MANAEWDRYLEFNNADLGMMPSNQQRVGGAPVVVSQLPVRFKLGEISYELPPGAYFLPPLQKTTRKRTTATQNSKPYIKKPPNAFMLFMKEQRPIIQAQIINDDTFRKDSATVNKILGKMWKSLTQDEQEKYFKESERLNQIHASMYPNWSCRDNYGKKKKRQLFRAATRLNYLHMSAPEVPVQAAHMPCTYTTCTSSLREEDMTSFFKKLDAVEAADPAFSNSFSSSCTSSLHEEDLTATLFKTREAVEAASPDSFSSSCTSSLHEEEELTSTPFLKVLEDSGFFSSSSTSTSSLHEDHMTTTLYETLEAVEAADAAEASSDSFSSSCTSSLSEEDMIPTSFLKMLEAMEAPHAAEASSASFSSLSSCSNYSTWSR